MTYQDQIKSPKWQKKRLGVLESHGFQCQNCKSEDGGFTRFDFGYTQFAGSARAPVFFDSNDTSYYVDPNTTGDSIRVAGNIVAYFSDDKLKTKFGNITNALDKVCSLNGFYYEANETAQKLGYKAKREVGVSAQEVQAVLPEVVTGAPVGHGYLS